MVEGTVSLGLVGGGVEVRAEFKTCNLSDSPAEAGFIDRVDVVYPTSTGGNCRSYC